MQQIHNDKIKLHLFYLKVTIQNEITEYFHYLKIMKWKFTI